MAASATEDRRPSPATLMSGTDLNLRNLLCNPDSQRRFLLYMETEFWRLEENVSTSNVSPPDVIWRMEEDSAISTSRIGDVDGVPGCGTAKRKRGGDDDVGLSGEKGVRGTSNQKQRTSQKKKKTVCLSDVVYDPSIQPDYMSLSHSIRVITTNLRWGAHQPSTHVLTWMVLSLMYISPRVRAKISEHTEHGLAKWFFHEFETRFTSVLCGRVVTSGKKGKSKKNKTIYPAYTPTQIVTDFRIFFYQLQTSSAVARGGI